MVLLRGRSLRKNPINFGHLWCRRPMPPVSKRCTNHASASTSAFFHAVNVNPLRCTSWPLFYSLFFLHNHHRPFVGATSFSVRYSLTLILLFYSKHSVYLRFLDLFVKLLYKLSLGFAYIKPLCSTWTVTIRYWIRILWFGQRISIYRFNFIC